MRVDVATDSWSVPAAPHGLMANEPPELLLPVGASDPQAVRTARVAASKTRCWVTELYVKGKESCIGRHEGDTPPGELPLASPILTAERP